MVDHAHRVPNMHVGMHGVENLSDMPRICCGLTEVSRGETDGIGTPIPGVYPIPGSPLVAAILGHVTGEWHASYVTESGTVRHRPTRTQSV